MIRRLLNRFGPVGCALLLFVAHPDFCHSQCPASVGITVFPPQPPPSQPPPAPPPPDFTVITSASPASAGIAQLLWHGPGFYSNETATVFVEPFGGWVFVNWTDNSGLVTTSPDYSFVVTSNRSLVANFRPLFPQKTTFQGLFFGTNGVSLENSGALTLTCDRGGNFGATLQQGAHTFQAGNRFYGAEATSYIWPKRSGMLIGTMTLHQDSDDTDQLSGTVTCGDWTANLILERLSYNSKTNPAPQAGKYTLVIPGSSEDSLPRGDSYANITVASSGVVLVAGSLADGTKFTLSTTLSSKGRCPLYLPLYKAKGLLAGWIDFSNAPEEGPTGKLVWLKSPAAAGAPCYPQGFAIQSDAIGSAYVAPTSGQLMFSPDNTFVTFADGGLSETLMYPMLVGRNNQLHATGTSLVSFVFSPQNGMFHGQLQDPSSSSRIPFNGVILQRSATGGGYFLRAAQSGRVEIGPGQ